MKPGPRALYVELKRRFNGGNNGQIFLSHHDAAKALNVGRDTVAGYFSALIGRGFIEVTRGHCLGPEGVGQAATYALTEEPLNGVSATKDFREWREPEKQKPRGKNPTFLGRKIRHRVLENPTAFSPKQPFTVSENPAIYTSSHILMKNISQGLGLCGKENTVEHLRVTAQGHAFPLIKPRSRPKPQSEQEMQNSINAAKVEIVKG